LNTNALCFFLGTADGTFVAEYFLTLLEIPNTTLLSITRIIIDGNYRKYITGLLKDPILITFWKNEFEQMVRNERMATEAIAPIQNRIGPFLATATIRNIIGQAKSTIKFDEIMNNGKILLVNLSKGRLGDINANLIGLVLVGKIQMAALSRVDMFGKPMNDFYLYIDEFQNVTTDSIASILSEARKYRLSLNIAHQYITQLEENIKNAVFGNVGSMAVFRVGTEDASFLEPKFKPQFTAQDITKLDNYNAYMSMLVNGQPTKPFNLKTLAPEKGTVGIVDSLKELSYIKYGRDRAEVEAEIMGRYKSME